MVLELSAEQARRLRARAQLLGGSTLEPADVVRRAVAMQGQDLPSVLRAIALRARPGSMPADVRSAFDDGTLVRSWPMRGTLFVTTPRQLASLLHFTAERIHRAGARRREQLGLDDRVIGRAREVLQDALAVTPLTRAEMLERWEQAGIATGAGRGYHLIAHLAIDGMAHWGGFAGSEQLLTLTAAGTPRDPETALAEIAGAFVASRGPVTDADLAWWTKLPKTLMRRALTTADGIVPVTVEGAPAWIADDAFEHRGPEGDGFAGDEIGTRREPGRVSLVPGFDEWVLSYADRSLIASPAMLAALVPGGNGLFRPAVLVDGVAVGTWRLGHAASDPTTVELVERVPAATRRAIQRAVAAWPYG
jgi:hypothetical protein